MSGERVDVSVLVPVLNEAKGLREIVAAMAAQRFDGRLELLFVDGGSEDGTRAILEELAAGDPRIRVLDNPRRLIAPALNIGLRAARGEFVARMDAHTLYPDDYLQRGIERLRRGDVAWVAGPQLPSRDGAPWSRRVALALQSPLGVGGAAFRGVTEGELETDAGFTGLWRRETLERHGGWNEDWVVNEDGELAARIRADGGRIVTVAAMGALYVPRDSLEGLARQYWRYGQYRAKTSGRHPESMRRSHLVPPAVAATVAAALAAPRPLRRLARAGAAAYALAIAAEAVRLGLRERDPGAVFVPAVLATMHLAWGA
ncbi:MAG: succinoglycan biosynthesis protein ExoA, partial [Thermoleophilaceae bacterium]|nr:succinoglycan biosynthesis protein ExoA [Thermoleophilaceae bacterium]